MECKTVTTKQQEKRLTMVKKYKESINIIIAFFITIGAIAAQGNPLSVEQKCDPFCLDLSITGGYANYDIEWQKYDKVTGTFAIISGWPKSGLTGSDGQEDLCSYDAEKYKVIVHDALCGVASIEYKIDPCKCGQVEVITESVTNVSACGNNDPEEDTPAFDNCDGSATVSASGIGSSNATFSWSNGMTGTSVGGLCTGTYTVTVTSSSGCTASKEINICCCNSTSPTSGTYPLCGSSPTITDADIVSPTSSTAADGSITLITTGNTQASNVMYKWEGPGGFKSNSKNIAGLKVGTYCVTMTDGCSDPVSKCYTLVDCSSTKINVAGSILNTCGNYKGGKIIVVASGGMSPYRYKWSNGASGSINDLLGVGNYCVTVTDKQGCRGTACFTIDGSTDLTTIRCEEFCNGNFVNSNGPEVEIANPQNCFQSLLICDKTGKILEGPYNNYYTNYDRNACIIDYYNNTTNQFCYTSYGTQCNDCIIFEDKGLVFCCEISYCFFSNPYGSIINSIREFNSVTSISVGDGKCFVQIFDDCKGGVEVANGEVDCKKVPVQDGDCGDMYDLNTFYIGSFGNCGGFGRSEQSTSNDIPMPSSLKPANVFQYNDSIFQNTLKFLNQRPLLITNSEDCQYLKLAFVSNQEETCTIAISNKKGMNLMSFQYFAKKGLNNLTIDKLNTISDSIEVEVKFDTYSKIQSFYGVCTEKYPSINLQITIVPNPTTGMISLNFGTYPIENLTLKIYNDLGSLVLSKKTSKLAHDMEVDLSEQASGLYYFYVYSNKGALPIKNNKILKL